MSERLNSVFLIYILLLLTASHSLFAQNDSLGIRTVVIDPGHGGKDPGCLGKFSHEADVALAISLYLGEMIKNEYGNHIKVVYTRTKDQFVDLAERAKIANKHKADLFICIHANASQNTASKGTETYVLGLHKTDAQFKVAERENSVILTEDNYQKKYQNFNPKDPDNYIALSLIASAYLKGSMSFAEKIQQYMAVTPHIIDRGVKQAGFLVLHQVNMPSVLIETGFLTNPEEEKVLNDKENQKNIALAIFKAFVDYKNEIDEKNGIKNISSKQQDNQTKQDNTSQNTIHNEKSTEKQSNTDKGSPRHPDEDFKNKVLFKIQFTTSPKALEINPSNFKGLENVEFYYQDGIYKYTYGKTTNFEEAKKLQTQVREKYPTAFVVCFLNGERIQLQKAIELAEK
jgi:N-acetylmuramoyl-L-alanine amidase